MQSPPALAASAEAEPFPYPRHEEVANTITHALGLLIGLWATLAVVVRQPFDRFGSAFAFGIYASTLLAVYAASAGSHAFTNPRLKYLFRVWDQGLIYCLIAGTYTPFVVAYFSGWSQHGLLIFIWFLAGLGFASKVLVRHRINGINVYTYILLGWVPALALCTRVDFTCFSWILAGGIAYTVGTYFLTQDRTYPYFHAVWHSFVILGSTCHFLAVVWFTLN